MMGYYEKVQDVRDALQALGARVRVDNRQLKYREKTYLHIRAAGGEKQWKTIIEPLIQKYFPDAYMTSGHWLSDRMKIVVALEK
jgi:hypothetical protein